MSAEGSNPYAPPQDERDIVERAPQGPPGTITCTVLLEVSDMMAGIALTGGKRRWLMPVLLGFFALMNLLNVHTSGWIWQVAPALGLGILVFAFLPFVYRASAQRSLANKSNAERTVTFSFSPEFVEVTTSTTYARYQWTAVHRFVEGRDSFIFYLGEAIVQVVPKRALRSDDIPALRTMLEAHIKPRKKPPAIGRGLVLLWVVLILFFLAIWQFLQSSH